MERLLLAGVMLGSLALVTPASAQSDQISASAAAVIPGNAGGNLKDVPPLPSGKSTILGGAIRSVDAVRDQFQLHVYGEKPMKILFDERTQVFRDGKRIPLLSLSPADHASVQTTLDGAKIFALSVHILSENPTGSFQGRIANYDPGTGRLAVAGNPGQPPFQVIVTKDTKVNREGQSTFAAGRGGQSDLMRGALVSLDFQPDNRGQGIASNITVLATPGATFVFSGTVSSLNVAAGLLSITDQRDGRSYQIHCNPRDPVIQKLHAGQKVRITADYDGSRYAATQITEQ